MSEKTCFVIIGYGIKTDFSTGREINLDKTYSNIIEPVFKELGFLCFRASDIQHSGVIDLHMYENILKADFVLADLTTLNGKSGDTDHHNPVQTDHPKLTSFSCDKKVVFHC